MAIRGRRKRMMRKGRKRRRRRNKQRALPKHRDLIGAKRGSYEQRRFNLKMLKRKNSEVNHSLAISDKKDIIIDLLPIKTKYILFY